MTPQEKYRQDIACQGFAPDPEQRAVVEETQSLYERLLAAPQVARGWLGRWFGKAGREPVQGLYLWGGVGRGKTHLIDNFYHCLPIEQKRRVHFQRFMQDIHRALRDLPKSPDPLRVIADRLAGQARVLVIDEFHVDDIADAMILAGLLDALFARGVTLVTTSNSAPEDLYRHGLQRSRFEPAIALLKRHTRVVHLAGDVDYRRALLEQHGTYHVVPEGQARKVIESCFRELVVGRVHGGRWPMLGREVDVEALGEDAVWFNFSVLCDTPRSAADYQMLAQSFAALCLHHVPVMTAASDDVAQRFIQLIDALYDHGVKLIMTADAQPEQLYRGEQLAFPFQRTASRLHEMRSRRYLGRPHYETATTEKRINGGNGG